MKLVEADAPSAEVIATRYIERLTPGDLKVLADVAGTDSSEVAGRPALIEHLIAHPDTHRRLFGGPRGEPFVAASPFLMFAVLVQRSARDLSEASFTLDWVARNKRLPIFDNRALSDFLSAPGHRLFLTDLLASYTHVASGAFYRRDGRRWRAHRFNDLDPIRLSSLLSFVDEQERPTVLRRIGDASLFLTGVFPDHSAKWLSRSLNEERLQRVVRLTDARWSSPRSSHQKSLDLLEELGRRCYHAAAASTVARAQRPGLVASIADRFGDARRVLNHITDRYLFPMRSQWFPTAN